jgi:putative nucleotidyltransferase with HDIG domain
MEAFVATECDAWRTALDKDVELRLLEAIDELAQLPVLDGTVLRILELCDDAESTTADLVAALERDATFSANLLRYANSAALARPIRAKTVRQAVMLVGRRTLRRLTLETATYRFLERAPGNGRTVRGQLHLHAISVALGSAAAADAARVHGEGPHLAGLLHDVGKLVLPLAFGDEEIDAIAREHPSGADRVELERARLGVDHAVAGALLAERWGCPPEVVSAIAFHHGGPNGLSTPTLEIACVQVANAVADMLAGSKPEPTLLEAALAHLGLDSGALDEFAEHAGAPLGATPNGRLGQQLTDAASLAAVDELTGLATRRHWTREAGSQLEQIGSGSIVVCGVGGLAAVTRTHGYGAANLVLTEVARIVGRYGLAGRIGGVVLGLWVDGDRPAAELLAGRIAAEVQAAVAEDGSPPVQLVTGVACAPDDGTDFAALLEAADGELARNRGDGGRRPAVLAERQAA